mgnify:CR=1 FL=1|jgi:hypothetical protein
MKIGNLVLITLVGLVMIAFVKSAEAKIYGEQQAVLKKLPCDQWEKIKDLIIQNSEESSNDEGEREEFLDIRYDLLDEYSGIDMEGDEAVSVLKDYYYPEDESEEIEESREDLLDELDGIDMGDDEAVSAPEELMEKLSGRDAFVEALHEMVFQNNDENDCDE